MVYGAAVIGAVGAAFTPLVPMLGYAGAAAVGAVTVGVGVPVAGLGAVALGAGFLSPLFSDKNLKESLKESGQGLLIGTVLMGYSSMKSLFVRPFTEGAKLFKTLLPSKKDPKQTVQTETPAQSSQDKKASNKSAQKDFKNAQDLNTLAPENKSEVPASKNNPKL